MATNNFEKFIQFLNDHLRCHDKKNFKVNININF